jgi:anti-anti-sigma regulatory factor
VNESRLAAIDERNIVVSSAKRFIRRYEQGARSLSFATGAMPSKKNQQAVARASRIVAPRLAVCPARSVNSRAVLESQATVHAFMSSRSIGPSLAPSRIALAPMPPPSGRRALCGKRLMIFEFSSSVAESETETMSTTPTTQAHISYQLVEDRKPEVVVIEFLTRSVSDPPHAHELGEQLDSLICHSLPLNYVIDLQNVKALGSTAFGEICAFARRVRWWGGNVKVCCMHQSLQLGAALIGLGEYAGFSVNRRAAIDEIRRAASQGTDDAVNHPIFWN